MLRRIWQALRMSPAALMPLFLSPNCFFWNRATIKPNILENRIHTSVLESNYPCEDRRDFKQLTAIPAYAVAVYDGHGGWQVVKRALCSHSYARRNCWGIWTKH